MSPVEYLTAYRPSPSIVLGRGRTSAGLNPRCDREWFLSSRSVVPNLFGTIQRTFTPIVSRCRAFSVGLLKVVRQLVQISSATRPNIRSRKNFWFRLPCCLLDDVLSESRGRPEAAIRFGTPTQDSARVIHPCRASTIGVVGNPDVDGFPHGRTDG